MAQSNPTDFRLALSKLKREVTKGLSRLAVRHSFTNFSGLQLEVPLLYGLGAEYLVPDRDWTFRLLGQLLKLRSGALLDVGANVGRYLVRLRALDAERAYCGFEPNPACGLYIQELIRYNQFDNARLLPVALSNKKEIATFHTGRLGDKMGALTVYNGRMDRQPYSFDVVTTPGDEVVRSMGLDAISVCKIDVEGAEQIVIEGLRETLAQYRPYIICEIFPPRPIDPPGVDRRAVLARLWQHTLELRYRMFSLRDYGEILEVRSAEEIGIGCSPDHVWVPEEEMESAAELFANLG